jgi:hypothetical protein
MGKCIDIWRGKFLEVQPKMRNKRERKQMPLFYIQQPNINTPEPKMQKSYLCKDDVLESQNVGIAKKESPASEKSTNDKLEENTAKIEIQNKVDDEAKLPQENKKRPFNDLTIEEKIKHLKLVPASIAKVKYEFITVAQSYIGYFLDINNGTLVIHSAIPRKKNVKILVGDLVDIKRVGL